MAYGLAEAGNRPLADGRRALRDGGAAGIAAEVHVDVAAPEVAVLEEADEVAAVLVDRVDVDVLAADLCVERVRHPRRAVHGRLHLVGERLPSAPPCRGTAALRGGCRYERDERQRDHAGSNERPHAEQGTAVSGASDLGRRPAD